MEDEVSGDIFFSLFSNVSAVPKKSTPGKFPCIWHFKGIGINATKVETRRIHFQNDVFTVVAVVDAN